jgi:hypothetical protein
VILCAGKYTNDNCFSLNIIEFKGDALRKSTVEPVFGIIKSVMGFRQFMLRGLDAVRGEWTLVCMAWNLKRLHTLMK